MIVTVAALLVANSSLSSAYFDFLAAKVLDLSVQHWINDALMPVFFLLVGLEIKREILEGQLSTWPKRALPGIAAVGGMVIPAMIYAVANFGSSNTLRGWAIPAATDIAFALGVLSLLGNRVPPSLKVFLTALAILDDLGAIVILAVFYTAALDLLMLLLAGATIVVLAAMNRMGVSRLWLYVVVGVVLWFFVLRSGVHATLAGVALALAIPIGKQNLPVSPLVRLEHTLQPWVAFVIVPVFGFANGGLVYAGTSLSTLLEPVPLGIVLGLFIGKQVGVTFSAWLAVRVGLAELPANASWRQFYGVAVLCGIGFTMSLFIGLLAFPNSVALQNAIKIGVLTGSLSSALFGAGLLIVGKAGNRSLLFKARK